MLEELTRAFESPDRMCAAGYRIVSEFFDRHGWHLIVREIHGFWTAKPRFRSGQTTMRTSRNRTGNPKSVQRDQEHMIHVFAHRANGIQMFWFYGKDALQRNQTKGSFQSDDAATSCRDADRARCIRSKGNVCQ